MLGGLTSFPFPSRRLLLPRLLLGFLLLPTNLVWFPVLPIPVDAKLLDPETGAQARSYFGPLQPIAVQGQALSCFLDSVPSLPSLPAASEANPPPLSLWTASSMLLPGHLLPSSPSMIETISQDRSDHALSRSKPSSAFPRGTDGSGAPCHIRTKYLGLFSVFLFLSLLSCPLLSLLSLPFELIFCLSFYCSLYPSLIFLVD